MLNSRKLFFHLSLLILLSVSVSAQTSSSSPYSRYGIGDLQFGGFTKNKGMGGISLGYSPGYNLNISNPASYCSISLTTFETAVTLNQVQLKNSTKTQNINDASLSYFAFGFPVKSKKWGSCFGLLPYSNVGYSIKGEQINANGDVELHTYEGSGGLNQFFIGNSYSPFKNFSIGANASYLFGIINEQRRIEFPRLAHYFNTRIAQTTSVGSLYFNFGIQFTIDSLKIGPSDSLKTYDKMTENVYKSVSQIRDSVNNALNNTLIASIKSQESEKDRSEILRDQKLKRIDKIKNSPSDSIVMFNYKLTVIKDSLELVSNLTTKETEMKWEPVRKNLQNERETIKKLKEQVVNTKATPLQSLNDSITALNSKIESLGPSIKMLKDSLSGYDEKIKNMVAVAKENSKPELERISNLRKQVAHRNDKSDWSLTLGLVGAPQTSLTAENSILAESFAYDPQSVIIIRDTIQNISDENGKLVLPFSAGFGMMMKQGNRWLIGSDFTYQNWKNYSIFGNSDELANSWRVSVGAQLQPKSNSFEIIDKKISYWKKIQYRAGFHYEKTYLLLRNNQLNDIGVSVGLGLPVLRSAATLHISAEAGKRGTISNNLIQENYWKFSLGFTLNDRWFIKQRFD